MAPQPEAPLVTPALIDGLNKGEVVVSDVGVTIPGITPGSRQRFLLELLRAVAAGSLKADKVAVAVRSSGLDATADALGQDFADATWYVWQEVEEDAARGADAKALLADAAKDALKEQLATRSQLFEACDGELFEEAGLVVSKEAWRKKEIRSHTKHVYTQRKFNLLREEGEGWAKLATLLNQQGSGAVSAESVGAVLAELQALVGYFDLDPNRCFSLVLDALTAQPGNDALLGLLPAFSAAACAQVLGFHFYRCREDTAAQPPRSARPAPEGLYVAAAKIVRAGYCSLEALWAHLAPSDEDLAAAYVDASKKMAQDISRIGIISLVSAADTAAPLAPPGLGLRREPSGTLAAAGRDGGGDAPGPRRTGLTAVALELAAARFADPLTRMAAGNQKLLLLAAFLQIGDWEAAQRVMRWLRALGLSDFAIFPAVGRALCDLIGRELQPVYSAVTAGGGGGAPVVLPPRLLELLAVAGQHLYHNITVLTRLVRVLAAILAANGGVHPASKAAHEQVLELLTQSVLPAMSLVPGNAGLVYEIWAALQQLPYTDRFCLYADLKEGAKTSPLLTAGAKLAETEVRRILRRVTAPANKKEAKATMKPLGRMLAKICHAAPQPVAQQLIRQVMGMPGMVTSIVEALKYLTPMAFDVMTHAVLAQLASPKKKLKDDGVNLEEWYQWLAAFTGLLCKKHPEVEVVALLQYVANQLKSCESLDLLVLKEMVQTMTGHQAVFDVSEGQLDALAGSDTLKAEVITQGEHRASDKSLQRASRILLAALTRGETEQQRLAMPLLVLLAQQRKLIVLQSQSTHLKLIAELYDKCQEVCTQYADFLQHALPEAEYRALLPSMEDLAREYSVDPELIWAFYRPLIRAIQPPAAPGAAGEEADEEGEIGGKGEAAASVGPAAMAEDGQLEAGEVAGEGGGMAPPPPAARPDAAAEWAALEAQVLAMHGGSAEAAPWRGLSAGLYTTFWALQLYDLEVPTARYEATISQLRTDIRITQGDIDSAKRDAQRPPQFGGHGGFGFRGAQQPEVALGPAVDVEQLGKDMERAQAALDKLPGELKAQQSNAAAVERRLQREKGGWVLEGSTARAVLPREFAQYCVLPRMLNSPSDAIYCARFLKKVHTLDVPGFNLLTTINHVMREFGFLVRVCTAREATNFGIFLNEVLALVERWRSKDLFARECATSRCFKVPSKTAAAPAASKQPAAAAEAGGKRAAAGEGEAAAGCEAVAATSDAAAKGGEAAAEAKPATAAGAAAAGAAGAAAVAAGSGGSAVRNVDYREFLNLCHNWQKKLTEEVFSTCLQSGDYMQAKNALLCLNRCVKVYPATKVDAARLIEILAPIRDKDPREDLKTLARMYCTGLEVQMRDKGRNMVATREEYAGLPKKRVPRPAASKGAADSEGGKQAAAPPASKDGKDGKAGSKAGKDGSAADKEPRAGGADEARRTSDSSKGPALPPGLGGAPRGREQERRPDCEQERRRDDRPAVHDGPPPGFASADKLKHAGSTTELRRDAPAAGERDRRGERDRPAGERRDERPPRPGGRGEEARREQQERSRGGFIGAAALRPEAAPYVPREGGRLSSGSTRAADEPAAGKRDAKRPRRDEPAAAAAAGGTRARERAAERPAASREREREHASRERPAGGKEELAAGGRGERPASGERRRDDGKTAAGEAGRERGHQRDRPSSGERRAEGSRREEPEKREEAGGDAGAGSKRKREEAQQPADRQQRPPAERERERASSRAAAAKDGTGDGRPHRRDAAAEVEDARAAAKAAAGGSGKEGGERHRSSREPDEPAARAQGAVAEQGGGGGSSGSDDDRNRHGGKRDKKERRKKDKKEKKHRKKERSHDGRSEPEPGAPPAAAEEPDSKRRRREEESVGELPARLRGRLGSGAGGGGVGGLLGAALKGIAHEHEGGGSGHREEPAREEGGGTLRRGGSGAGREAAEHPPAREGRRGGRSRR